MRNLCQRIIKDLKPSRLEYPSSNIKHQNCINSNVKSSAELENIVADQFRAHKRPEAPTDGLLLMMLNLIKTKLFQTVLP